ncbi:hypothetical protein ECH_0078 [Ehrlichia chaffeensis str. Arkansas]|uniref:Uncharacterized protein n=1 Tax=Ehrlichia chaffeensis (strain ATCC CRL-10679 / Arkansas) TaxID=205920 RepID=Q2GI25_EHRCR|nr:hypothetical protein [Ehrlichia chaffeensis]ABD45344.1 hypothetical protein ECH_0078 [Ehrlichia chaffeensis str. Arkansas]
MRLSRLHKKAFSSEDVKQQEKQKLHLIISTNNSSSNIVFHINSKSQILEPGYKMYE